MHYNTDVTDKFLNNPEDWTYYDLEFRDDGNWHTHWRNSPMNYATIDDYVFKRNPLWIFSVANDVQVWYDDVYMGQRVICTNFEMTDFWVIFNQHTVKVNEHISVKFKRGGLREEIWKNANHRLHQC